VDAQPIELNSGSTRVQMEPAPVARTPGGAPAKRLRFRRIYILPTRQGMGFAGAVSIMLLGSINYANALGYALSFLLVGAALVSMLHAVRNLAGLGLHGAESEPVFAGNNARFHLRVDNVGQRARFGLVARVAAERRSSGDDAPAQHFALDADSVKLVELTAHAPQRGWFSPERVTIATRFPLGWFRAWSHVNPELRCLVFPRPHGEQPLPALSAEPSGEQGTSGKGEDEFAGLRDYQLGDSARRVHWKAVARDQGMPVKVFGGASAGVTRLRWQDVAQGDVEARLSQLCRWVLEADTRGLPYGMQLPGSDIPVGHGEEQRRRCLEMLALFPSGAR